MPDPSPIGEVPHGGVLCLHWESGTRSAAEGRDLAAVCRGISDDRLLYWFPCFDRGVTPHEQEIFLAEMARRGLKPTEPEPRKRARAREPEDEPGQMAMFAEA